MNKLIVITLLATIGYILAADCIEPVIGGAYCEKDLQCGGVKSGLCLNNTCVCNPNFYEANCGYKAKEALTAGLLGLTLLAYIPGIPSLYIGNLAWGLPQIIIGVLATPAAIVASAVYGQHWAHAFHAAPVAMLVWTLADAIQYGIQNPGYDCDGNGYPTVYQHTN